MKYAICYVVNDVERGFTLVQLMCVKVRKKYAETAERKASVTLQSFKEEFGEFDNT